MKFSFIRNDSNKKILSDLIIIISVIGKFNFFNK